MDHAMNVIANHLEFAPSDADPVPASVYDEPLGLIAEALREGFEGELFFTGEDFRAKVCLTEGRIAWARCSSHAEFFGAFLRQELGLSEATLRSALQACQSSGRRFGEELVERGIVDAPRLRRCLASHVATHLWHLGHTRGDFEVEEQVQRYRYGSEFTFSLEELLVESLRPICERVAKRAPNVPVAVVGGARIGALTTVGDPSPEQLSMAADLAVRNGGYGRAVEQTQMGPALFRTEHANIFVQPLSLWGGLSAVVFGRQDVPLGSVLGIAQLMMHG